MGKELESEAEIIAFEIEENEPNLARESIRSSCLRPRVELLMAMPWDLFLSFREAERKASSSVTELNLSEKPRERVQKKSCSC